jgi:hypothetical protein
VENETSQKTRGQTSSFGGISFGIDQYICKLDTDKSTPADPRPCKTHSPLVLSKVTKRGKSLRLWRTVIKVVKVTTKFLRSIKQDIAKIYWWDHVADARDHRQSLKALVPANFTLSFLNNYITNHFHYYRCFPLQYFYKQNILLLIL